MTIADFSGPDFIRIITGTVFCVATTVDPKGRPRGRVLHRSRLAL